MIYYHADDYGVCIEQAKRILACRTEGGLNSVSIMPTSDYLSETMPLLDKECMKSIHINISEGKALSEPKKIPMLVDENGYFNRSFGKLFLVSLFAGRKLQKQVEIEVYAQIKRVLQYMPDDYKLRLDSHRHYHAIPAIFRGVCKAAERTHREIQYIRLPIESFRLYLGKPSLWPRIQPLSIIKALVLNTCCIFDKNYLKKLRLQDKTCAYIGVIFTDRMFFENIAPLVKMIKAGKIFRNQDVEIQFHPGKVLKGEPLHKTEFADWFSSKNRDKEAEALKRFSKELL